MQEDKYKKIKFSIRELIAIHTYMSCYRDLYHYTSLSLKEFDQMLEKLEKAILGRRFHDANEN